MKKLYLLLCLLVYVLNLDAQEYYKMWRGLGDSGSPEWLCNSAMWTGSSGIEFTTANQRRGFVMGDGQWFIMHKNNGNNNSRLVNVLIPNANNNSFQAQFVVDANMCTTRLIVADLNTSHDNVQLRTSGTDAYLDANGDENGLHIKSNTGWKIHLHDQVGIGTTGYNTNIVPGSSLTVSGGVFIGAKNFTGSYNITSKVDKFLLWVQKGIVSENFALVKVTDWSDHVFNKDYFLRPLSEVEDFIKEKKHLPDVPSEKEIVANGYSVHDMNKVMMQKIEELTLYVIQQQKEIKKLKEQLTDK